MHLIFHIVHAAHARGARDRLALDALRHLECAGADRWRRLFLLHAGLYLEGAGAADEELEGDARRGEAADKLRSWYRHVVEALTVEDWRTAVYCAGALSRHALEPLLPLAHLGYAGVLDRAIEEARVSAPNVGLTAATLLAAIRAPGKVLARHRAGAEAGRTIERTHRKVPATGTVGKHPPEDDRGVRRPHASRVLPLRPRVQGAARLEADRRTGMAVSAEIIPLRRPAAPLKPAPATVRGAGATASNVTRQPMLFLVPSEPRDGGGVRPLATDLSMSHQGLRRGSAPLRTSPRTSS